MKFSKDHIRSALAGSFLILWMTAFFPVSLIHDHNEIAETDCHVNCIRTEEAEIHQDCDHELHLKEETSPCFYCEFTLKKTFLSNSIEFEKPEFLFHTYNTEIQTLYLNLKSRTLTIRGPPALG